MLRYLLRCKMNVVVPVKVVALFERSVEFGTALKQWL